MRKTPNILIIHLEFGKWKEAKSWSFQTQIGLSLGFNYHNITSIEVINPYGAKSYNKRMGDIIRAIAGNKKYDQVWMEVVQSDYDDDFFDFVCDLAPVRVAMIGESLTYTHEECEYIPSLKNRYNQVVNKLKYFTHALAVDESDIYRIKAEHGLNAFWWVVAIPQASIVTYIKDAEYNKAIFSGPTYGSRVKYLENDDLSKFMLHLEPLENSTIYPFVFDLCQKAYFASSLVSIKPAVKYNHLFVNTIRNARQNMFELWLKSLSRGMAVVQLPHFVKAFPSRVYEGIAVGRPVITPIITNRPRTMNLFENSKEIFYYNDNPGEVVEIIKKLQSDIPHSKRIAESAINKLKEYHTVEKRIKQILEWIESGDEPSYS